MLAPQSVAFLQEKLERFEYLHARLRGDFGKPLVQRVAGAVDSVERALEARGWPPLERCELYVVMPSLDDPAVLMTVELFGRTGMFPHLLMLRREGGEHRVYEVVDCERVKLQARCKRKPQTTLPEVPACDLETPPNSA